MLGLPHFGMHRRCDVKQKDEAAGKKEPAPPPAPKPAGQAIKFFIGPGRWLLASLVLLIAVGFGWNAIWRQVRSHVMADPQYQLTAEQLRISEPPSWIRSDLRTDVLRNASLDASLSLLDDELTVRIAHAFALHPWVANVIRVSKTGSGVDVELEYRRPIAMVQVPDGVFPIDRQAVLLPNEDFTAADVKNYPRITEVASEPTSPVGSVWQDPRLIGAASLAELLTDHWSRLKLQRISVVTPPTPDSPSRPSGFTLYTQSGTQIRWGGSPAEKPAMEMSSQDKLALLLQYATEHGTLDAEEGRQVLDLQSGPTLRIVQNTIKPLPKEEGSE
jgi:hypothetical protein